METVETTGVSDQKGLTSRKKLRPNCGKRKKSLEGGRYTDIHRLDAESTLPQHAEVAALRPECSKGRERGLRVYCTPSAWTLSHLVSVSQISGFASKW
jgi:hypothetical protein